VSRDIVAFQEAWEVVSELQDGGLILYSCSLTGASAARDLSCDHEDVKCAV
jgi:hypothetical protein